jgi:phosphocarrier protein HPr
MPQRTVTVASRHGLHARPAALFVKAAADQAVAVRIGLPGGRAADARSILAVLALNVGPGAQVVLEADGDGADQALDTLAALLAQDSDGEQKNDEHTQENAGV